MNNETDPREFAGTGIPDNQNGSAGTGIPDNPNGFAGTGIPDNANGSAGTGIPDNANGSAGAGIPDNANASPGAGGPGGADRPGKLRDRISVGLKYLFEKGAFYIFAGNFLSRFTAFFGSIFLIRILSKERYGILVYAENIYTYACLFAGLGMAYSLLRYMVLAKSPEEKLAYYRYAIRKSTIINVLLVVLVAVVGSLYPHPEKFSDARWLLPMLLLVLPFQNILDHTLYTHRAQFANKRFAVASLLSSVFVILARAFGGYVGDLFGVAVAVAAANALVGLLFMGDIRRTYFKGISPSVLSRDARSEASRYSLQYMATNSIWAIIMLNDIFLLGQLLGNEAIVADYKVAYVLPANLSIISAAVGIFVGPYFVRREKDRAWVWKNYKRTLFINAGAIGAAAAVLYVAAEPIITLLYGTEYSNVVPLMRVLLIAAFINSGLRFMTAHLLSSMNRIFYNIMVSLSGVLLQIGANIYVIPRYGSIGVAYVSVAVFSLMTVALLVIFVRLYRRPRVGSAEAGAK